MVLNEEMEIETLIQFGTQLFEDRLVLNPVKFNPDFFFFCPKSFSRIIFCYF